MALSVAHLEKTELWIVFQGGSDSCLLPIFNCRLAAEMFAAYYGVLGISSKLWQPNDQLEFASKINAFAGEAFGKEPDSYGPDLPIWLVAKLAEDFSEDDGEIRFGDYWDLTMALGSKNSPIWTLIDAYKQWEESHLRTVTLPTGIKFVGAEGRA